MTQASIEQHIVADRNSQSVHKQTFKYLDEYQEAFIPKKLRELQG